MRIEWRDKLIEAASTALSRKAKLSIYWSVYVPLLTYRHKLWVENKIDNTGSQSEFLLQRRAAAPPQQEEPDEVVGASD